jgi:DNA topoisomerase II
MSTKAQEFGSLDVMDHIRTKDMWAGSFERIATQMIIFSRKEPRVLGATYETIALSPALFKCFDEPIVNALDQAQRCPETTEIRVDFNEKNGRITVSNNGDGIPITAGENTDGVLIPEFVFGKVFAGSNMATDETSTIGGTNGVGVKITNIHSLEFRVETHDKVRNLSYAQTWSDGMHKCTKPLVTSPRSGSGTSVSFLLNYEHFKTAPSEFEPVAFTRVIWAAFYVSHFLPDIKVFWNGKCVNYGDTYARAIFDAQTKGSAHQTKSGTQSKSSEQQEMRIFTDQVGSARIIATPDAKRFATSVINGIIVPQGNHLTYILKAIREQTKEKLMRELHITDRKTIPGERSLANRITLIVLWRTPGVHWNGQSKDNALFKASDLKRITPTDTFTRAIADVLAAFVMEQLDRTAASAARTKKPKIDVDKYTPAHLAGTGAKQSARCRLFLAEGDSAKSQVESGISRVLGFDYYGVLSLRGVIPNVRKESVQRVDGATGTMQHKRSKKLIDNKFMNTLVQVLGIDFTKRYETARERATLRYGGVIGCVDQDLDGIGNIFSLLLNLFHLYWPALLAAGYVQRLATPIIRAYPKLKGSKGSSGTKGSKGSKGSGGTKGQKALVLEFYSDEEYRAWASEVASGIDTFKIHYYKGLGKHSPEEMQQIMRHLETQIITYKNDDEAQDTFEIYLGRDPALRREQLSQEPPDVGCEIDDLLEEERAMHASHHLLREAHAYQLDNLHRKINDVIGGTNQVACKIINGCLKIFARGSDDRKVADIAGTISSTENYHHGEASLQDAIIRRGFIAPGGNQLPLLLPHGNFGTRLSGGQDAASPRYVTAAFNTKINSILYQAEDYALLDFHIDEGKRGEPRFFVPIVPIAILENVSIPAHGWNISIHAREVMDVIANLRAMIATNGAVRPRYMRPCCFPCGPIDALPPLPAWNTDAERVICDCSGRSSASASSSSASSSLWHGYVIERACPGRSEIWSLGSYEWISEDTIQITELPLGVWTHPYMKQLVKIADSESSIIASHQFSPSRESIDIRVTFDLERAAALLALLTSTGDGSAPHTGTRSGPHLDDPIICALHLRDRMTDNLNFMMPNDSVATFKSYEDVLAYWFPYRRDFYARRITRQREMISMWILYYENIVRYIESARLPTGLHVATMTVANAESALAREHFDLLNIAALESPEMKFTVQVAAKVRGPDASYAYLLNLRERDITTDGCAKYAAALASERNRLSALNELASGGPFPGANIWLQELDALARQIEIGRATQWQYDNFGHYEFPD